eukprot:15455381-Alexandrium_andersonii.AAC.1
MEESYDKALPTTHILLAWCVRHAAWLLSRFQIKSDGRTPFARVYNKGYKGEIVSFAENVLYKYAK